MFGHVTPHPLAGDCTACKRQHAVVNSLGECQICFDLGAIWSIVDGYGDEAVEAMERIASLVEIGRRAAAKRKKEP